MSEASGAFDGPGLHVIATDIDVDDVADLLARLQVPVDAVIDGDLALSPYQDAAENLFLGHEPRRFGLVDRGRMRREAAEVFRRFGLDLVPDGPPAVRPQDRLLFAVARVAVQGATTCAINADRLDIAGDAIVRASMQLTSAGVRVIVAGAAVGAFLSAATTITVVALESGVARVQGTCGPGPAASDSVVALLATRPASSANVSPGTRPTSEPGAEVPNTPKGAPVSLRVPPLLSVSAWTVPALPGAPHAIADRVSFEVHAGEVLALTGLGSRELALSLFGSSMGPAAEGSVTLRRRPADTSIDVGALPVSEAISAGISYGSERPLAYDVGVLGGIPTSVSGASLKRLASAGVIDGRRAYRPSRRPFAAVLRGGEDPSAFTDVLRSWSDTGPATVILDEPFVTDRAQRLSAVRELAGRGAAVLVVSARPADIAESAHRLLIVGSGSILGAIELSAVSNTSSLGRVLRSRLHAASLL
jgi:ABC-type uncharacterized transport system ATPase subunit